jgi:hypothetical protein
MGLLTLLAVALSFSIPSHADSDGCFCTSRGYLAYEMRGAITPGVAGHVLRIVRFEAERGIYIAGEVTLEDFQVHRMICDQDRVEISGWERISERYVIEIAGAQKIHILEYAEDPTRRFDASKEGPEPAQLGYGHPGTLPLESLDPNHKYEVLRRRSEKAVKGGLEHHVTAELLQVDLQGTVSQRCMLY